MDPEQFKAEIISFIQELDYQGIPPEPICVRLGGGGVHDVAAREARKCHIKCTHLSRINGDWNNDYAKDYFERLKADIYYYLDPEVSSTSVV